MSEAIVTVEDAAFRLAELVEEIAIKREPAVLTKAGRPVARIVPIAPPDKPSGDLIDFLRRWRAEYLAPDDDFAQVIADSRCGIRPPRDPLASDPAVGSKNFVDSSVVVGFRVPRLDFEGLLADHSPAAIAAVTAAELLIGVEPPILPKCRLRRESLVEGLFAQLPIVPFNLAQRDCLPFTSPTWPPWRSHRRS